MMEYQDLFERFSQKGRLCLPDGAVPFGEIPWNRHRAFEGVELKHIVTAKETGGRFSFHLVRVAPGKTIGSHVHPTQLETHEVIAGSGACVNNGVRMAYEPGTAAILPAGTPHQVEAGPGGLYLFAKFIPALC